MPKYKTPVQTQSELFIILQIPLHVIYLINRKVQNKSKFLLLKNMIDELDL